MEMPERSSASCARSLAALFCAVFLAAQLPQPAVAGDGFAVERTLQQVGTAAGNMLVLSFTDADTNPPPSQEPEKYRVGGERPVKVGRCSATIYEEKCTDWAKQRYPQILSHRIYLQLAEPLVEGKPYEVLYDGGRTTLTFHAAEMACESFRVNQVGYNPLGARRDAFWAPWCGDLGVPEARPGEVWLCESKTGARIAQIPIGAASNDERNGGPVWRLDLAALTQPGTYYLLAPGVGRSADFGFGDLFAHHTFFTHMRGLYHERCGVALTKPFTDWERLACHAEFEVTDAPPPDFIKQHGAQRIPHAGGGHHDAGDFDIRLAHTLVAGWLLNAYELFPEKFTDGQLALPESGNGIPDLLDEALFSIRAWETLQEEDGGIRAGWEADKHPTYGEVNAATDKLVYRTFARHGHTTLAGAALMAYAARLVKPFDPQRAAELLARAQRAWAFYERHRDDPAYRWSHGALLFASGQLYLATGEAKYHEVFREQAYYAFDMEGQKSKWPAQYHQLYFNLVGTDEGAIFTHYFISYLLDTTHEKDAAIVAAGREAILRKAKEVQGKISGDGFATVSTAAWGGATGVGRYGDFLIHAWRLTGDTSYRDAAVRLADWSLGVNPPGWCFTTGLGTRPPYNPAHLDSYYHLQQLGPVPGLVLYGYAEPATGLPYVRAVLQHLYPAWEKLPAARRVCDGWSLIELNEFTVWETMAPNAFLHACLAPEKPLQGQLLPFSGVRIPGGYPVLKK